MELYKKKEIIKTTESTKLNPYNVEGFIPVDRIQRSGLIGHFGEGFTIEGLGILGSKCRLDEHFLSDILTAVSIIIPKEDMYRKVYVFKGRYNTRNFLVYLDKGWGAVGSWNELIKTDQRQLVVNLEN